LKAQTQLMEATAGFSGGVHYKIDKQVVATIAIVDSNRLKQFDIKQPVYFADINWNVLTKYAAQAKLSYNEIARFPAVERDLAIVIPQSTTYAEVEQTVAQAKVNRLKSVSLFDVFESEKIGAGKKSMALNFVFQDDEKTLTDQETEKMMNTLVQTLEKQLAAEIRK
jgi:phenylalanyl-tRNA synthetase beta chain